MGSPWGVSVISIAKSTFDAYLSFIYVLSIIIIEQAIGCTRINSVL